MHVSSPQTWAQSPLPPAGSVEGHVICDDGNVPARGALVILLPLNELATKGADSKNVGGPITGTDFSGYYVFLRVDPGTYVVEASKDGYSADLELLRSVLGRFPLDQRKKLLAGFPQVTVAAGTTSEQDVVIHRAGAVSGRVTVDGGGVPGHVKVTATMVSSALIQGLDASASQAVDYSQSGPIDDRGVYRIAGLPAGKYRLSAQITESFLYTTRAKSGNVLLEAMRTGTGSLIVYAPEALAPSDARVISIGDGDEIADADLNIPLRLLHSISGTITVGGIPMPGVSIKAKGEHTDPSGSDAMSTADGSYRFDLLPSGTYTIAATVYDSAKPPRPAVVQKITVQLGEEDLTDADLEILPSAPK
jgi:hypothetical protein